VLVGNKKNGRPLINFKPLIDQHCIIRLPNSLESDIMRASTLAILLAPTLVCGQSLNDKFKAKGKLYFGTEIDHYHLNNAPLTTIVKNSFGQITNENSMKWDAIEREYFCY
jgi:GH35 family endo-1,4-beta-xylanase